MLLHVDGGLEFLLIDLGVFLELRAHLVYHVLAYYRVACFRNLVLSVYLLTQYLRVLLKSIIYLLPSAHRMAPYFR